MKKEYPVFDRPTESTFYNPYSITFGVGKDATGSIVLDEDAIDAIVSERLKEKTKECTLIDENLLSIIKSYL